MKAIWITLLALTATTAAILLAGADFWKDRRPLPLAPGAGFHSAAAGGLAMMNEQMNRTHELLAEHDDHIPLALHWQGKLRLSRPLLDELKWNYLMLEKEAPYVGDNRWLINSNVDQQSSSFLNALAVFAHARENHEHGDIGITPEGKPLWRLDKPLPTAYDSLTESEQKEKLKDRGFYEALTDALPLDREPIDTREPLCKAISFDIPSLPDASIVITFVNEPLSTLLRTVHSVLNHTPSPILREIILVDDHSDFLDDIPGGPLYEYIRYLPKVKLMRLPERRGIVQARMAGARAAKGDVLVILDSHIEVNKGWLEPQLARILESPKSVVFPKILGISPTTFEYKTSSGIGCSVSWRWSIVEQSTLTGTADEVEPIPSSSMAGGLFAISREYFFELGGYDEGFIAWGAENVEFAFRVWMCGGRVECAPCSRTYHVYRKGSTGYANPQGALWTNRMRTARIWMDEYFQLAARLVDVSANKPNKTVKTKLRRAAAGAGASEYNGASFGDVSSQLALKERLQCKSFKWFLENVDPHHDIQSLDEVLVVGRISSGERNRCLDLAGKRNPGDSVATYACHSANAKPSSNQSFLISSGNDHRIRLMTNDKRCLAPNKARELKIVQCMDAEANKWRFKTEGVGSAAEEERWRGGGGGGLTTTSVPFKAKFNDQLCLSITPDNLTMTHCDHPTTNLIGDRLILES